MSNWGDHTYAVQVGPVLEENNAVLLKHVTELEEAMNWFCDRVERGEVRSHRTYHRFCELLGREPVDE